MRPVYNVNATREYFDPEEAEPSTIFTLGVLDAQAQRWLDETFSTTEYLPTGKFNAENMPLFETRITPNLVGKTFEAVRLGLKGIKNFGHQISFTEKTYPFGKRTVVSNESMDAIKPFILEVGLQILKDVAVEESDSKK